MNRIIPFISGHLRPVLFLSALLLGGGILAAFHLRQELEPAVATHYAIVTAELPGSTAQELQETVTHPVEELLRQTPGVSNYQSRTWDGICLVTAELEARSGSTLEIRERLRSRLAGLSQDLSRNIVGLAGPRLDDSRDTACDLLVAIPAPGGDLRRLKEALPSVVRELAATPGVQAVETIGLPVEQVIVEYRDAELANAGFSPQMLSAILKTQSFLAPGGYVDDAQRLSCVHVDARLRTLEALREVAILDPLSGRPTTLDRLLDIKTEPRHPAAPVFSVAGAPGVCLAVSRRAGTDPAAFSARLRRTLEASCQQAKLASPVVMLDNAGFIKEDTRGFLNGLGVSAAIILVLLVAAMGFRTGGVVATMIPLVILSTLATLQLFGGTLNLVVLAALTIASGIITDNHIVVAQYLSRRLHGGHSVQAALGDTFRALAGPLLAATLAAVAGFLPVIMADHVAGEYLADLVPVVGIALFFSYLYAFTITPFLCRPSAAATPLVTLLERSYRSLLVRVLARPALVLAATGLVVAAGIACLMQRPSTFFPANDRSLLAVEVLLPAGTSQDASERAIQAVGTRIASTLKTQGQPGASWMTLSGRGLPRFSRNMLPAPTMPNTAVALVSFDSARSLRRFQEAFASGLQVAEKGAVVRIQAVNAGPQVAWPVQIRLQGPASLLPAAAAEAEKTLAANPALLNLHRDGGGDIVKWSVLPKRQAAADKAVTPADIALALNAVVNGLPSFDLGAGSQALPVFVRPKRTVSDPVENLKEAYVYPARGQPCLLDEVAEIKTTTAPACVECQRGVPAMTLVADVVPGANPYQVEREAVARLQQLLGSRGVSVESAGLAATASDANRAILEKMPWALAIMFLVLLFQTRSFRLNMVVLAVIPFGIAGAGFGLAAAGMPVGFMPLIGLTCMAGIAVNITIVMVAAIAGRAQGRGEAGTDAWILEPAVERVEPILLSAACAVGGMIPLYVFGGELWHSMVVTLVSGLLVATLLIVVAVPAAFKCLAPKN